MKNEELRKMEEKSFENYLWQEKLSESTIRESVKCIERFKVWTDQNNINLYQVSYAHLLEYVQQQQQKNLSPATINIQLIAFKKFYNYLIATKQIKPLNPAQNIRLKCKRKKALISLLDKEQLETLYQSYANKDTSKFIYKRSVKLHRKNTVMLGFMVYQGMSTSELGRLEAADIDLQKCTIYIASAKRSNSRILKLEALQMIRLQDYMQQLEQNVRLFTNNIHNQMDYLLSELRVLNKNIRNAQHIRDSVIMQWLRQYNLRQVQYMIGHKHIGSTERYKQEDLRELQTQLELFHPIK